MKKVLLGEISSIASGGTPARTIPEFWNGDIPWVKTTDINQRFIREAGENISMEGLAGSAAKVFSAGTLLMAMYGQGKTRGKVAVLSIDAAINQACAAIQVRPGYDSNYVFHQLEFRYEHIRCLSHTGNQENLNAQIIRSIAIPSIALPEQKKIAEILGACDEAIEAQERLIAQKQQRKKGLMQQLLTGKKRFPQFAGTPWRCVKIGSLLKEVKRYVDWDDEERYQLLSLRRRSGGPFARESLLGSEIKTKTLKTVHAGDFLIAKMQVTHGAFGMVADGFDGWKVSDSYICMVPRDPEVFDVRFFNYLSQDRYIWHLAYVSSYGVAIEKMTFVLKDFLKKEISIPPTKEEASAIADCIDVANQEITLQQNKLEQIKQQKKGLMQLLLTGKVRVKL